MHVTVNSPMPNAFSPPISIQCDIFSFGVLDVPPHCMGMGETTSKLLCLFSLK